MEEVLEGIIRQKSTEKGTIVTIGCGTTEADDDNQIELYRGNAPRPRRFLNHSLLKSFITGNNLHCDNLLLLVKL